MSDTSHLTNKELHEYYNDIYDEIKTRSLALAEKQLTERRNRNGVILSDLPNMIRVSEHSFTSCTDQDRRNVDYQCPRCVLLAALEENYIPDYIDFQLTIKERSDQ